MKTIIYALVSLSRSKSFGAKPNVSPNDISPFRKSAALALTDCENEPLWPKGAEPGSAASKKALNVVQEGTEPNNKKALNQAQRDKNISKNISKPSPNTHAGGGEEFIKFWSERPEAARPRERCFAERLFVQLTPEDRALAVASSSVYRATQTLRGGFAAMIPYFRDRRFLEFDSAPAIDREGYLVIQPDREEWTAWLEYYSTRLNLKSVHHFADTVDADLGVLGLAVPQPPAQALDSLRHHPRRIIGYLLQVLQPHGDVEPIEDRRLGDAGGGQYGSETGASIGETGQLRVAGPANGLELPADQRDDVGIGSDDGSKNLASSSLRLDIADPDCRFRSPSSCG